MRKDTHQLFNWSGSLESLEERLAMSADPIGGLLGGQVQHHAIEEDLPTIEHHATIDEPPALDHHLQSDADFWIDQSRLEAIDQELGQIEQSLANAHDQSGLTQVRSDYGFDGTGQTVAIIDSGIAYDHFALGEGFGSNYRVVGGWDFTGENDADPYDDGPSGSHGTHVAGIVGASGGTHDGVAPGVDLVGLRVFDDAGDGYFSWVENALQWVHDNRDSFENPITAVNLSLGVATWNSDAIPSWANLENEFAQLEQDGIFISVSAGNSYTSFNTTGLSYPAASPYVIPVASVDDSGLLSYFSQRNSRVIAAPGRGIISTVPDYKGDNNNEVNDYASFSGTSMAAPYVAGASVIIREAMEFAGYSNITQDTIYDHMIATADSFFDSATNQSYSRLNLEEAIDALMPTDDYGSTTGSAYSLGTVSDPMSMNGAITTLDDVDYFSFTAGSTGSVSFTVDNLTHSAEANWDTNGNSASWGGANGETLTIDVVAGQEYTIGFMSSNGLGYYDLEITSESSFTYTDWGSTSFSQLQGISIGGETWYRVAADNAGYFTTEAMFDAAGGQISLEIYDSSRSQLIDTGNPSSGTARVDAYAAANEELFLKVTGTNSNVDFRLTNLVSVSGTTVHVAGTAGDDAFAFTSGSTHEVAVNGTSYTFDSISIAEILFSGQSGDDSILLSGTSADETFRTKVDSLTFNGVGIAVSASDVESSVAEGGGGYDLAYLHDSSGADRFYASPDYGTLTGSGAEHTANGFDRVYAIAENGGDDRAHLFDSDGNDRFYSWHDETIMKGSGFYNKASGFDRVYGFATTGDDRAHLHGTDGNDLFHGKPDHSRLQGTGFYNWATGFNRVYAFAYEGTNDRAYLYGSEGDDIFHGGSENSRQQSDGYYNYVAGYDKVVTKAGSGGNDRAYLYDSAGDDVAEVRRDSVKFVGSDYSFEAEGYDLVQARGTAGGNNEVQFVLHTTPSSDDFVKVYSEDRGLIDSVFSDVSADPDDDGLYSASTNVLDHLFTLMGDWS